MQGGDGRVGGKWRVGGGVIGPVLPVLLPCRFGKKWRECHGAVERKIAKLSNRGSSAFKVLILCKVIAGGKVADRISHGPLSKIRW